VELECEGSGTEQDPAIITASEQLPGFFRIMDTHLYINMVNCHTSVIMGRCSNISIINCKFKLLALEVCTKMKIRDCIIKSSSVRSSSELEFEGCSFKKLKITKSMNLDFTNCSIAKLKEIESRDVAFKDSSIQEKKEKAKMSNKVHYIADTIFTIVLFIIVFAFQDYFILFLAIPIVIFVWVMDISALRIRKKRLLSQSQEINS